jgi:hypothetical protein
MGRGVLFEQFTSYPWLKEKLFYNPKLKEFARQPEMILPRQKFFFFEIRRSRCMDMIFTDKTD